MSDEERPDADALPEAEKSIRRRPSRLLRRLLSVLLVILLLPVVLLASLCLFSRSSQGERWILSRLTPVLQTALAPSGLSLQLQELHSNLPFSFSISGIELTDSAGLWLQAEKLSFSIKWSSLLKREIEISDITLASPDFLRFPEVQSSSSPEPEPSSPLLTPYTLFPSAPEWLANLDPQLILGHVELKDLTLPAALNPALKNIDLRASARISLSEAEVQANILHKNQPGGIIGDKLALSARLTSDATLGINLAVESSSGFLSELLPPVLAEKPEIHISFKGDAPLEQWEGTLQTTLTETATMETEAVPAAANSSVPENEASSDFPQIAALTGLISFSLPPSEKNTGNPWIPRQAALNITLKNGEGADRLLELLGLEDGNVCIETSLLSSIEQPENQLHLQSWADISIRAKNSIWKDPRLTALLGSDPDTTISLEGRYSPEESYVKLSSLLLTTEMISADGHAQITLPGFSSPAEDSSSSESVKEEHPASSAVPDLLSRMKVDAEIHAASRDTGKDITALFSSAGQNISLNGPLSLDMTLSGTPVSPRARLNISCPALNMGKEQLSNLALQASLDSLEDTSSELHLSGNLDAGFLLKKEHMGLQALWLIRRDKEETLTADLSDMKVRLGGARADGSFSLRMDKGQMPCIDGGLIAEIQNWKTLSVLTGQKLSGSSAHVSLSLNYEKEKQRAAIKGGTESFSVGKKEDAGTLLALNGLELRLDAEDIWKAATLDARMNLSRLDVNDVELKTLSSRIQGALNGPVKITASTDGAIKSNVDAVWSPGEVTLKQLSVEAVSQYNTGRRRRRQPGNEVLPGLALLSPGTLKYTDSTFSTSGLEFKLAPEGSFTLKGSYAPSRLNLDVDLKRAQFAPFRIFTRVLPDGTLNAAVRLRGTLKRPSGTVHAEIRDVRFPESELVPLACDLNAELSHSGGSSILEAKLEVPFTSLALLGARQGQASLRLPLEYTGNGLRPARNRNMKASIRWDGVVSPLWSYLPIADRRMSGGIHLAADLSGTLAKPQINADLEVSNAAFEDLALGVLLRNINARASYTNRNTADKKDSTHKASLSASGGDGLGGTFKVEGDLNLAARTVHATLNLDKLKPLRRQDLRIDLSGDGLVMGTLQAPFINANITVNEGELSLANLPSSGGIRELPISEGDEVEATPPRGILSARIVIPRRFYVRGRGLESEWKGNLHIGGPLNAPGILGSIDVVRGDFNLLNRDFTFSKGSIQFTGSTKIDPSLDIVMSYKASAIVAEAIVGGTTSRPTFKLTSQPSLPQDEIISQIMFGKYAQNLGRFEAIQLAGGVAALAGIGEGGLGVLSTTRKALGVDMLRLNSSSDSDTDQNEEESLSGTTLEMGKYVTDKIYVGVEQGMKSDTTGALVEIELTPEISLEAKTNSERTEAAVQWQHNY